jgi:hypothetical protein
MAVLKEDSVIIKTVELITQFYVNNSKQGVGGGKKLCVG